MDYLTTHTSLSPIFRGFAPGFVNYKKGCTRLAAATDKDYQLLAHGRWFSPGTLVSSTNKADCRNITEILLKVRLNTINQPTNTFLYYIHIILCHVHISLPDDIVHGMLYIKLLTRQYPHSETFLCIKLLSKYLLGNTWHKVWHSVLYKYNIDNNMAWDSMILRYFDTFCYINIFDDKTTCKITWVKIKVLI